MSTLELTAYDYGYLGEVNQVVSAIDFADSAIDGYVSGYTTDPLTPDDNFAVEYTGYLNITSSDTYSFNAYTDDGFRLVIGNEIISQYENDRAVGSTVASVFLNAGLYEFSMIGWEQGLTFVNELSWHDSSTDIWSLVDSNVLFTNNSVPNNPAPEPATMLLLGLGLLGLAGVNRKKTA